MQAVFFCGGVFWKKLELTFSKIPIYDFRPLLPRQSSIDFQNGKFFFPLKKNGGREILKKMEEKFSVLNSDEIGGGSNGSKMCRLCLNLLLLELISKFHILLQNRYFGCKLFKTRRNIDFSPRKRILR
jgi:hypothetical protein